MSSFSDKLQKAPKGLLIMIGVTLIILLLFGMYKFAFEKKFVKKAEDTEKPQVVIDFPDAEEDNDRNVSKVDEIRRMESAKKVRPNEYWNSLGNDGTGGLVSSGTSSTVDKDALDPNVYSDIERYYISNGTWTKEEVDRKHEEERKKREEEEKNQPAELTAAQQDSIYLARMEKAYQLAQKYTSQPDAAVEQPAVKEEEMPKEEPKHIDLDKKALPSTTLRQEGIITSLDSPSTPVVGGEVDSEHLVPARATFLSTEKLITGQRVTMRLLQDLQLSDGTVVPANTHIKGICKIDDRLKISISTINYGGKIYYTNLDIYDNDGTEGIYCPVIVQSKKDKSGEKLGKSAIQQAASIAGSAMASNPYLGRMASQSISEITQMIDVNGNVSVSVSSGYEFFVFESVEKNEKDKRNKQSKR